MESYKSILRYNYLPNKRMWNINISGLSDIVDRLALFSNLSKRLKYIVINLNKDTGNVLDFFLLELEYILDTVLKIFDSNKDPDLHNPNLIINYILEIRTLLSFIREMTWVKYKYTDMTRKLNHTRANSILKYKPLTHQKSVFDKYLRIKSFQHLNGAILDMAPGTGKTFTSLYMKELLDYDVALIIVPKVTIDRVWVKSLTDELYKKPQSYYILPSKIKYKKEKFIITHYEYLEKLLLDNKMLTTLKRLNPMIIVDEFHNFNTINSKRTISLISLVKKLNSRDIVLLTGTPLKMDYKEYLSVYSVLDSNFKNLVPDYLSIYSGSNSGNYITDMLLNRFNLYRHHVDKNTDSLPPLTILEEKIKIKKPERFYLTTINKEVDDYKKKRLKYYLDNYNKYNSRFMYLLKISNIDKKLKDEYLLLVEMIQSANNLLEISDILIKAKDIEREIEDGLNTDDMKEFRDIKSIIKYPKLKVLGEALGKIVLKKRIEAYKEIANTINYKEITSLTKKKVLVFSNYIEPCKLAKLKANSNKLNVLEVYGEFNDDIGKIIKEFHLNPKYKMLVATYNSLSTGVPVTVANVIVCLDIPYRMYMFDQAISRAYRIGQDKPVKVLIFTIDSNELNITDRNLFILNQSEFRSQVLTGNKLDYKLPKSRRESDLSEDEVLEELSSIALGFNDNIMLIENEINIKDYVVNIVKNKLLEGVNKIWSAILKN